MSRTLHLVDSENLHRGVKASAQLALETQLSYSSLGVWHGSDLMLVGSSALHWIHVAQHWVFPHRWLVRDGSHGGENAILEEAAGHRMWGIDHVVIASGDHAFASLAHDLQERGRRVTVVSWKACLSRALANVPGIQIQTLDSVMAASGAQLQPAISHQIPNQRRGSSKAFGCRPRRLSVAPNRCQPNPNNLPRPSGITNLRPALP